MEDSGKDGVEGDVCTVRGLRGSDTKKSPREQRKVYREVEE